MADTAIRFDHGDGSTGIEELFDLLLSRPGWHAEAACRTAQGVNFYPGRGGDSRPARAVCAGCPVSEPCLRFALEHHDHFGIWGGLTERERTRLRRRAAA